MPAVRLADDEEPRLKGLALGKGTSLPLPDEPGRVWDEARAVEEDECGSEDGTRGDRGI